MMFFRRWSAFVELDNCQVIRQFMKNLGSKEGLARTSSLDTTTNSSTMLSNSVANASTLTAATGFSFGVPTTSARTFDNVTLGFGLEFPGVGGAASTPSTTTSTTTTTTVTTNTTTTISSDFTLNLESLTSTGINSTFPGRVISVPFTSTVNAIVTPVMTYGHLQGLINKWNYELQDYENHFLYQAAQISYWDRALLENGEKIITLHREVEKVKLYQKRLEQELDFILLQQNELEKMLIPLQGSVWDQNAPIYLQHATEEHERTCLNDKSFAVILEGQFVNLGASYRAFKNGSSLDEQEGKQVTVKVVSYRLTETIDAQLKQMAQDLKDIIEHLNAFGSPADTTELLQQICKSLNVHMDSLQWIDQSSGMLQRKVEEVTQVFEECLRKEQERKVKIAFD